MGRLKEYEDMIRTSDSGDFYIFVLVDLGEEAFRNHRFIGVSYFFKEKKIEYVGGSKTRVLRNAKFREPTKEEKHEAMTRLFEVALGETKTQGYSPERELIERLISLRSEK